MDEVKRVLGVLLCLIIFHIGKGQVVSLDETYCELKNASINCNNAIIAVESLNFYYHPDCANICCSYNNTHSSVGADDNVVQDIRRECSGRRDCFINIDGKRGFGSDGLQEPSYAVLQYTCISKNSTVEICKNEVLKSNGFPLYLTNVNYPSVTSGNNTCSCSIEVNSCTSNVTMFILDVDLYLDHSTCEQNIELKDGMNVVLERLHCGGYNNNSIIESELRSHYLKIDFINNSTQNQEGLFFIGFAASEGNVPFSLSCPSKKQTMCLKCEDIIYIPHGDMKLYDAKNTSEGAMAYITCDTGYESDRPTITCSGDGKWENATCLPKDCGNVSSILNGKYVLEDGDNTTYGAMATLICNEGYESNSNYITCLEDGQWSNASCNAKDCGKDYKIDNGKVSPTSTTYGEIADVTCNTGYTASTPTVTCLSTGKWEVATCKIKDCGSEYEIMNGKISFVSGDTTYGAVGHVTCDKGYKPSLSSIICLGTGKWEVATCSKKDCGKPPQIPHGSVILAGDSTFGSTAEIKCQEGYSSKNKMIKCEETGLWESVVCKKTSGSEDGSNTGTILAAIFIPILLILLLIVGCCLCKKYRQQGYLFHTVGHKGHESVSFKNKEVLPEDEECQNTNLVISNETEPPEEKQSQDTKESVKKEESFPEEKINENESTPVTESKQCENSDVIVKNEEKGPCQDASVSVDIIKNGAEGENMEGDKSNEANQLGENGYPKQDEQAQKSSETTTKNKHDDQTGENGHGSSDAKNDGSPKEDQEPNEESKDGKNEEPKKDERGKESNENIEIDKTEEKQVEKDQASSETREVCQHGPSEDKTSKETSISEEVCKKDLEVDGNDDNITNEIDKNKNMKSDGDIMSETTTEASTKNDT